MQPHEHHDVVARVDGIEARVLAGSAGVQDALELLDRVEAAASVPLVDESERARLEDLASGTAARGDHWHSILARTVDDSAPAVGYAALLLPPAALAHGDVAIDRERGDEGLVLTAMLAACEALGRRHDAARLQVWIRHVTGTDVRHATTAGWCVDRRLGVLSRQLDDLPPVPHDSTEGLAGPVALDTVRDDDTDDVVATLAAAYEGTPDAGWTRERFEAKRSFDWFDPADLLVARDPDGRVRGLHWTKRRGDAVGEVYNLAVHPDAQGRRLGALLLAAGLRHLRDQGCTSVLLWVDLANERAVRLYVAQGFSVAWEDVALGREVVPPMDHSSTSRLRSVSGTSL